MHNLALSAGLLATLALAAPAPLPQTQSYTPGFDASAISGIFSSIGGMDFAAATTSELDTDTTCRPIYFIVARGSMEPGNLGVTVGPPLCKGLKTKYGQRVGCQGIDPNGYSASIIDNIMPKGTSDKSIAAGVKAFEDAAKKCPKSTFVTEGYSQGAALLHNVVSELSPATKQKIAAVILFGDTKNKQSNAMIDGFPKEKTASFCAKDDGVCWGGLSVTGGHLAYLNNGDEPKAVEFMIQKLEQVLAKQGAAQRLVGDVKAGVAAVGQAVRGAVINAVNKL